MKKFFMFSLIILLFTGCNAKESVNTKKSENSAKKISKFEGVVVSTADASRYTYIEYKATDGKVYWAAVPQTKVKKGDKIKLLGAMPMQDFNAKALGKHFDLIFFAQQVMVNGAFAENDENTSAMPNDAIHSGKTNPNIEKNMASVDVSGIKKVKGGYTIKELIEKADSLNGKTVKFSGVVVKFSPNIMGKNWVHLKDASTNEDITLTTKETFKVGEKVVVQGKLVKDKDFGYGYYYKVLIEEGKKVK